MTSDLSQVSPQNHGSIGGIMYESNDGAVVRCNASSHHQQNLEIPIQEKLRQLPMVVKYMMEQKHKSIR